ncbi:4-coumarate--CoA ligase [Sphingomonas koreensis]|jgi:acyl-CoA synthetase (AMP-forming)/AMP-acid ligase II|uniref:4-coumarate--CoA ligase n=1 Tax=Sphingomonas koreensis TaxID=93064 RepID=A0A1L6JA64_9SPHN|nr:class I adenylate-forming enzyme family protein [Sphingomonas koreensis]APR52794.1 4-coumarate--CoA ligase [Sphingomonas koreensis]MDC7811126.1 class I adenylate-forming enzyme family protein [Sphingomonas koreensis]RSU19303.1 4-coumarate--CoA ligase [Sphingomonas koreensis]RSU28375.1 4-coumarate--CoA ligase [Sphingomonas koreensis]RSU31305.1 4-coumarate--CoA ligase [Sphingomonas koreensis]
MQTAADILTQPFATLSDLIAAHARERGSKAAIIHGDRSLTYAQLDARMDAIAAALQRDGLGHGQAVAIVGAMGLDYAALFLGAIRAGGAPAPVAPSSTGDQMAAMIADSGTGLVFLDADAAATLGDRPIAAKRVALDASDAGIAFDAWLGDAATPAPAAIAPEDPFNIIYSSGTTGTPKGIVQPHAMRWAHIVHNAAAGFGDAVTMIATPLYSNTTLVSFIPTLGWGGTAVLLGKFDARGFLEAAAKHRGTHAMLVPVQYQRIMAVEDFDRFDLTSFRVKTCTSAPFSPALKADVLARWPGMLIEYYGMTEGGGTCVLMCNMFPNKLHTVGMPVPGHDIRLIDDEGREVPQGEMGEVVGRSPAMMSGYHGRKQASADAEWFDAEGNRYIRHGDVGRFDEDGFLTLMDRKKDLIISGGFNIYPSDLEAELVRHPAVRDCAVVGVPSEQWGETPVAFYVPADETPAAEVLAAVNAVLGKTQRLAALLPIDELPRSAIGKVLKRELRDRYLEALPA